MVGCGAAIQLRPSSSASIDREDGMGAGDHFLGVERGAEQGDEARRRRAEGDLPGRDRQPALHRRRALRRLRQPIGAAMLLGEIDQDGVRIADDDAAVIEHRHLAEAVHLQEGRLLVRAGHEVDRHQLMRDAEQRQEQADAMGMARQRMVMELHDWSPE